MERMLVVFLLLYTVINFSSQCNCATLRPDQVAAIDDYVNDILACSGIPGMVLSVVSNDQVQLTRGYGKANLETGEDMDEDHLVFIGSTTKAFTSALLAKFISQNEFGANWDTPVRDILGDWFYFNSPYTTNSSTLRDLLAHKMSLPRYDNAWTFDNWSTMELLERVFLMSDLGPYRATGLQYNNIMYTVSGVVAEVLAGGERSYEQLLTEELLAPLDMSMSHIFDATAESYDGYAIGYTFNPVGGNSIPVPFEAYNGVRSAAAAGFLVSSANDMAKWLLFLLRDGQNQNGNQVVNADELTRTFRSENVGWDSSVFFQPGNSKIQLSLYERYALAWFVGYYRGFEVVSHGGDLPGYHTYVSFFPDMNVGIYSTFTEWDTSIRVYMHANIFDIVQDLPQLYTADVVCSLLAEIPLSESSKHFSFDVAPVTMENIYSLPSNLNIPDSVSRENGEYAGVYGNHLHGNMFVEYDEEQDELFLTFGTNGFFRLNRISQTNTFIPVPVNRNPIVLRQLTFSESIEGEGIDQIYMPGDIPDDSNTLFVRDLDIYNLPSRPNLNC